MLRLTRQADYGIVLLSQLAAPAAGCRSASELSRRTRLPEPTVRKILKALTRAGLLESRRGIGGGYALARPAPDISVAAIVEALEGPIGVTECSPSEGPGCRFEPACPVAGPLRRVNDAVQGALAAVTLGELLPKGGAGPAPA